MPENTLSPAQRIQVIIAIAQLDKPADEAGIKAWEAARQIYAEYREVTALPFFKKLRRMPELSKKTDAFYDQFVQD